MGVTISLSYQGLSQCPLPNVIAPTQNQVVLGKAQELVVCIMLSRAKIYHVAQKFRALENDWLAG